VVKEPSILPFFFRVALFAGAAERLHVFVIFLMARVAIDRGGFVVLIRMALLALGLDVFAPERKLGLVMVE
jgi:hypothetical protein